MKITKVLHAALIAIPVLSPAASETTDTQIAQYQSSLEAKCMDAWSRSGEIHEEIEAYCTCMIDVLKEGMTHIEWRHASLFARNQQHEKEMQVLGPHLNKARACRNNMP